MPESYSIAILAASRYLGDNKFYDIDERGFECDEGSVQIVAKRASEGTHLVIARAKRARGEVKKPVESEAKMRRIAMAYLIENPDVDQLRVDIIEVLIQEHATVSINGSFDAYSWER